MKNRVEVNIDKCEYLILCPQCFCVYLGPLPLWSYDPYDSIALSQDCDRCGHVFAWEQGIVQILAPIDDEEENNLALKHLNLLLSRIYSEIHILEFYAKLDQGTGKEPGISKERTDWFREWLSTDGTKTVSEIKEIIRGAGDSPIQEMADAIDAFNSLITVAKSQNLSDPENKEMFWRSLNNTLPSLRWSFEDYKGGEPNGKAGN